MRILRWLSPVPPHFVAWGVPPEADTAVAWAHFATHPRAWGVASESDTAVAWGRLKSYTWGVASETDTAVAWGHTGTHPHTWGVVVETDAAVAWGTILPVIVPFTADELLDLTVTPRRIESFRFDVQDRHGNTLGVLAVVGAPRITNDVSRRIKRDLTITIPPRSTLTTYQTSTFFSDNIDAQQHRIKVVHTFGSYENPMGLFVFSLDPRSVRSYGETINASLDDLSQIFDQKVIESYTWPAGTNIADALGDLYAGVGLTAQIDATTVTLGEAVTMLALKDSRQSVAETFCRIAGFLPPYFDNAGVGVCRAAPDVTSGTPSLVYGTGSRAYDGTVVEASSLLVSPNVWVAEATSLTDTPLVGRWALDPADSHSFESIGYWIPEQVDVTGIDTLDAATEAARAASIVSRKHLRRRSWSSPVDSRHDTFDPVAWDDEIDLEQSWSAELVRGGTMTHESMVLT